MNLLDVSKYVILRVLSEGEIVMKFKGYISFMILIVSCYSNASSIDYYYAMSRYSLDAKKIQELAIENERYEHFDLEIHSYDDLLDVVLFTSKKFGDICSLKVKGSYDGDKGEYYFQVENKLTRVASPKSPNFHYTEEGLNIVCAKRLN